MEFGRRALAEGNMWKLLSCLLTLLKIFDKNIPEIGTDSAERQMHYFEKMMKHYWVNMIKKQDIAGGCPILRDARKNGQNRILDEVTPVAKREWTYKQTR